MKTAAKARSSTKVIEDEVMNWRMVSSSRTRATLSPTRRLYELFWAIHNMKEQNPDDVVRLAAEHNIHFLPPPPA